MVESSAAASTLTRPRLAVAVIFGAASLSYVGYYLYRLHHDQAELASGPPLHRSNAVHRLNRRSARVLDSDDSDEHGDENVDTNARAPLMPGNVLGTSVRPDRTVVIGDGQVDGTFGEPWYDDPSQAPRPLQRTGENIVTLLFRVSEDNARRNAYVHRGCQCNGCGMVPIRGIRYRCANCADFDLCEVCESQGLHNKTHVFYKVRVPAPPFGPRHVQPAWYPGDPDHPNVVRSLPRYLLAKWSHETGFERVELDAFWEQWTFMANTEWREDPDELYLAMDRKTFERCLVPSGGYRHTSPNLIHDRMFSFYDTNKDDLIGFEEFLHGVSYRKRKDKLKRTFDGYDIDADGYVNRRDFLRMFRAYYVLYKQMHRDILDGLDDHMMTTTEAQQLVNSRAPLSSLFGREGRVPPGDHARPMEGKMFHSNGEVDIRDGKEGVVTEDKPDISARDDILTGLFTHNSNRSLFTESFGSSPRRRLSPNGNSRYLAGIVYPPQSTVDLAALVNGDSSQLDEILASIRNEESRPDTDESALSDDENRTSSEEQDENATLQIDSTATSSVRPRGIPDAEWIHNQNTEARLRAQGQANAPSSQLLGMDKRKRVQARKQLHERWRRRQFYLDEEEGATPPQGWNENEDVLVDLNGIAESSKSPQQILSPRSRSSSKVRFVEETDDFDTRSNPSTSSRSVPERWGGMEIPDAERDAGKEIMYQVTQHAFNELLDELFKKKEDLAIQCAETKEERDANRPLFEQIQIDRASTNAPNGAENSSACRPIAERSLDELLTASGYEAVHQPDEDDNEMPDLVPVSEADAHIRTDGQSQKMDGQHCNEEVKGILDSVTSELRDSHDPTMPQFRPNSLIDTPRPQPSDFENQAANQTGVSSESDSATDTKTPQGLQTKDTKGKGTYTTGHIPHATLEIWKHLDLAEQEARERGGWGKLNYEEFEAIYKDHELEDSGRNRLDYLGSWIDFCIP